MGSEVPESNGCQNHIYNLRSNLKVKRSKTIDFMVRLFGGLYFHGVLFKKLATML